MEKRITICFFLIVFSLFMLDNGQAYFTFIGGDFYTKFCAENPGKVMLNARMNVRDGNGKETNITFRKGSAVRIAEIRVGLPDQKNNTWDNTWVGSKDRLWAIVEMEKLLGGTGMFALSYWSYWGGSGLNVDDPCNALSSLGLEFPKFPTDAVRVTNTGMELWRGEPLYGLTGLAVRDKNGHRVGSLSINQDVHVLNIVVDPFRIYFLKGRIWAEIWPGGLWIPITDSHQGKIFLNILLEQWEELKGKYPELGKVKTVEDIHNLNLPK